MKNFILLLFFFSISINNSFSQSRIIMGGGAISPNFENSSLKWLDYSSVESIKPFVGFTFEQSLNKKFAVATNINYSLNKITYYPSINGFGVIDFIGTPEVRFVHLSLGSLMNYKIFKGITKSGFLNGFNIGVGLNIDSFRDFDRDSFGFNLEEFSHKDDRYQVGFLSLLSWEHKKFRLSYNFLKSLKMFGNHDNLVQSTDWRTLSASYIYTLSE